MSKHRRLELEHFCAQYYEWKEELYSLNGLAVSRFGEVKGSNTSDPTAKTALRASILREKMAMIEDTAKKVELGDYIFEAVTKERTFGYFEAKGIPCCRNTFYQQLRKFYFLLDKVRQ